MIHVPQQQAVQPVLEKIARGANERGTTVLFGISREKDGRFTFDYAGDDPRQALCALVGALELFREIVYKAPTSGITIAAAPPNGHAR